MKIPKGGKKPDKGKVSNLATARLRLKEAKIRSLIGAERRIKEYKKSICGAAVLKNSSVVPVIALMETLKEKLLRLEAEAKVLRLKHPRVMKSRLA